MFKKKKQSHNFCQDNAKLNTAGDFSGICPGTNDTARAPSQTPPRLRGARTGDSTLLSLHSFLPFVHIRSLSPSYFSQVIVGGITRSFILAPSTFPIIAACSQQGPRAALCQGRRGSIAAPSRQICEFDTRDRRLEDYSRVNHYDRPVRSTIYFLPSLL